MSTFDPIFSCTYAVANCLPSIDGDLAEVEEDPEMSAHDDFLVDFNSHSHASGGSFPPAPAAAPNLPEDLGARLREFLSGAREVVHQPTITTTGTSAFPLSSQPTGWICPRCQLCLAPSQASCARCAPAYVQPQPAYPVPSYPYPYQPEPYVVPTWTVEPYVPTWTSDSLTFRLIGEQYSTGTGATE